MQKNIFYKQVFRDCTENLWLQQIFTHSPILQWLKIDIYLFNMLTTIENPELYSQFNFNFVSYALLQECWNSIYSPYLHSTK